MFEILKGVMALRHASEAHGTETTWHIEDVPGLGLVLKTATVITEEDRDFADQMRQLLA